jgi:two-component sensor histidine kinase
LPPKTAHGDLQELADSSVIPLLLAALSNAAVGVVLQDSRQRNLFATNLPERFLPSDRGEPGADSVFGNNWGAQIAEEGKRVIESSKPSNVALTRDNGTELLFFQCTLQPYAVRGKETGLLITIIDLTAERKREDTLKALLRELSHRTKNLLAIVQSIAAQTARSSETLHQFQARFFGRIASLSTSQDLVTDSNWNGAFLFELADRQFSRYLEGTEKRVRFTGSDIHLSPNAATHIGLALHELIVNATLSGAFSELGGRVTLDCRVRQHDESTYAEILWLENVRSPRAPPANDVMRRFDNTVLERIVPTALNGNATYEIAVKRVKYALRFPLSA